MIRKAITIFRRFIIVVLTLAGLAAALAWATSYDYASDFGDSLEHGDSYIYYLNPQACFYLTSLSGRIRVGSIRVDQEYEVPPLSRIEAWAWPAFGLPPEPDVWSGPLGTRHLGGVFLTIKLRFASGCISGFAIPHWVLCVAFLTYPTLAFIRDPLRSYRRRKRGLCPGCG